MSRKLSRKKNKRKAGRPPLARQVGATVDILQQQAIMALQNGNTEKAIALLEKAIARQPDNGVLHNNLGIACKKAGRPHLALRHYRRAAALLPDSPETWNNYGNLLRRNGQLHKAVACFEKALALRPDFAAAANNLGNARRTLGDYPGARQAYETALRLQPDNSGILLNLGTILHLQGDLSDAETIFLRASGTATGNNADLCNNLANLYRDQRRLPEAIAMYREALRLAPGSARTHSNLLLALHYQCQDPEAIFEEHRRWPAGQHRPGVVRRRAAGKIRKIRIGYLSADFRRHPVACFIEPVLAGHDRQHFEIFCYSNTGREDEVTDRLRQLATFRPIFHLDDQTAARRITDDRIDILVDLSGHTRGNRLLLMAGKPAPLQATWIGYPDTTGLPAIDYRITDAVADPPGSESFMTETPARLPRIFLCYRPAADVPPAKNGDRPLTLGSCSTMAKITDTVLDTWAAILRQLPDARLLVKNASLGDRRLRKDFRAALTERGVDNVEERIRLTGFLPGLHEHLAFYNQIDIALDTFPYNGTTTTCEALWMGTPVITLRGHCHAGRVGAAILTATGLEDLIAESRQQYVELCLRLAAETGELRRQVTSIRCRLQHSPIMDPETFCRDLETMYRSWIETALP